MYMAPANMASSAKALPCVVRWACSGAGANVTDRQTDRKPSQTNAAVAAPSASCPGSLSVRRQPTRTAKEGANPHSKASRIHAGRGGEWEEGRGGRERGRPEGPLNGSPRPSRNLESARSARNWRVRRVRAVRLHHPPTLAHTLSDSGAYSLSSGLCLTWRSGKVALGLPPRLSTKRGGKEQGNGGGLQSRRACAMPATQSSNTAHSTQHLRLGLVADVPHVAHAQLALARLPSAAPPSVTLTY